jgi:hypothetical protein
LGSKCEQNQANQQNGLVFFHAVSLASMTVSSAGIVSITALTSFSSMRSNMNMVASCVIEICGNGLMLLDAII